MINLNIDESVLENQKSLAPYIYKILYIKLIAPEGNTENIKDNYDFYFGDQPLIPNVKDTKYEPKVFNLAKPITDIATKIFIGEQPDLVTSGKESEKEKVYNFKKKLASRSFHKHIFTTEKNSSICGSGYLALYNELGDEFPRFRELNPQFADVVYDCSLSRKRLLAINVIQENELVNNIYQNYYLVYVYTKKNIFVYRTQRVELKNPLTSPFSQDLLVPVYSFMRNGEKVSSIKHGFSDIPIVEFPNNDERCGDFECVKDLIYLYNNLQNNRLSNVNDIVNYVLMLKNVRIGNDEEKDILIDMLKNHRLLPVEGENVDARFLSNQLDQSALQTLANDIKNAIHYISRVPDLSSVDFSQNASDPILKIKTKPLLDLCAEKELSFTEPLMKVLTMALDFAKVNDKKGFNKYGCNVNLIDVEYAHELPSNDLDMITQITNLANSGILNPEIGLQHLSWVKDVNEYIVGMDKYNKSVDKRKIETQNKNNSGINETNLKRQNAIVENPNQYDNVRNKSVEVGNKISENKIK